MKSFFSTLRACKTRYHAHSATAQLASVSQSKFDPTPKPPSYPTFDTAGVHSPIVASLQTAFPNVQYPTATQAQFIPAILSGKDVLLKDVTGSGKSFGLVLALLSKPRVSPQEKIRNEGSRTRRVTSLVIVPHRDLAHQLYRWILKIMSVTGSPSEISTIAQVVVRDGGSHLEKGLHNLRETPPHILIGTPQAIMDIYRTDPQALHLKRLSSVVVDEVDYLIETAPRKDPSRSFYKATAKAKRKLLAHPGVTRQLLDIIFASRKEMNAQRKDESGASQSRKKAQHVENPSDSGLPQLILSSATLRGHLNQYLFEESGWLNKDYLLKVRGGKNLPVVHEKTQARELYPTDGLGGGKISHSVLLVSEDGIENIVGAAEVSLGCSESPELQTIDPQALFAAEADPTYEEGDADLAKFGGTQSPFNPNALEAIATAFALDVPSVGLLVLPSSSPVQRAVYELREMGINAQMLNLATDERGRCGQLDSAELGQEDPTLLVSTLATTRGLDLPALTHVFILGIPNGSKVNGKTVDAYVHLAGRVGRFGGDGKVITVVEKEDSNVSVTQGSKMLRVLKMLNQRPVRFPHFD